MAQPRKAANVKRTEEIKGYFSPTDKEALKRLAAYHDTSFSDLLRKLVREADRELSKE